MVDVAAATADAANAAVSASTGYAFHFLEPAREPVPPDTEPEYVPEPVSKAQPEPNELTLGRKRMKRYYGRTRSSALTFRRGDKVYLLCRNNPNAHCKVVESIND